jgi:hypothetical protein
MCKFWQALAQQALAGTGAAGSGKPADSLFPEICEK